ncbi:MAG: YncE family protein [Balneolaceae bacterium]|nr:YncE family protein [Balneolaceae bacterium]
MKFLKPLFTLVLFVVIAGTENLQAQDYYAYVAAESEDMVHLIHFNAETQQATIAETIEVGRYPTETDGPHGITVAPDGKHWFVSIAHGNPYGMLAKYSTETNKLVSTTDLGMFPASMEISEVTGLLYVVNFNLHGEMKPSSVSVVEPESMTRITDIETGIMPHGSRIGASGKYQYHVSMMTDELIQINTQTLEVSKRFKLSETKGGMSGHKDMDHSKMEHKPVEKPTWAHPHPTKPLIYVAANGSDELLEINTKKWEITQRYKTGKAPYNLEVTPDGKYVVVTYKGEGATGIWDLEEGKEVAKIENSRKVSHGVTISPDSKYAFISVEGIGGEPGSVEVINLQTLERVDVVETGKQAGGIYFWKQS